MTITHEEFLTQVRAELKRLGTYEILTLGAELAVAQGHGNPGDPEPVITYIAELAWALGDEEPLMRSPEVVARNAHHALLKAFDSAFQVKTGD